MTAHRPPARKPDPAVCTGMPARARELDRAAGSDTLAAIVCPSCGRVREYVTENHAGDVLARFAQCHEF